MKKKKATIATTPFVIRMETSDGVLVSNRNADRTLWDTVDARSTANYLEYDCRNKGVKLISFVRTNAGIFCIVEWLSTKIK